MKRRSFVISLATSATGLFTGFGLVGQKKTISPDLAKSR